MRSVVNVRPARRPHRACAQHGFTLVEVTIGAFLVAVGLISIAGSFDVFRTFMTVSSSKEAAAHVAQQELEQLRSRGWKELVLAADPGTSSDPKDPRYRVVAGSPPQYRPSADAALEPLSINPNLTDPAPIAVSSDWESGGVRGKIWRFVTKPAAGGCANVCPKRVTVAVTVTSPGGPREPTVASTLVADPQDKSVDENAATPPQTGGPSWLTYFPSDTPAGNVTRVEPSSSHAVHRTHLFPDLLFKEAPPNPNDPNPPGPLYRWSVGRVASHDLWTTAQWPGGRTIDESAGGDGKGEDDSHWWVTPAFTTPVTLTGNVGGSIWAMPGGGLAGAGQLTITVYDVRIDATGKIDDEVKLNATQVRVMSALESWPEEPGQPVEPRLVSSFAPYRFLASNVLSYEIGAGRRIGIKLSVEDDSVEDMVILYDHPDYASSFQIETTAPQNP